jgi:hypothetical protein
LRKTQKRFEEKRMWDFCEERERVMNGFVVEERRVVSEKDLQPFKYR